MDDLAKLFRMVSLWVEQLYHFLGANEVTMTELVILPSTNINNKT